MKRHTCIICGSKRVEHKMENVFLNSWACKRDYTNMGRFRNCYCHKDIDILKQILELQKKLSLLNLSYISKNVSPERTLP